MKKAAVVFLLAAAIGLIALLFGSTQTGGSAADTEYLRIHIRANSNGEADQAVKYKVRDGIVAYLTPLAASCTTKQQAINAISENLAGIEAVAERVLREGAGDNWWCVVYPPLCFTGGNVSVTYRSKILEIIESFFD